MRSEELYQEYKTKMQKIADVKYASAVLQWDQETYLPPKGNELRGQQIATLSEIAHDLFTDEKLGNLLNDLAQKDDLLPEEKRNIELTKYDFERNKKLSGDFVRKMSESVNRSYHAWAKAYKKNSFTIFEPHLHELIELKKQEADHLGYEFHPYNALMNDYHKGLTVKVVDQIFDGLIPPLLNILEKVNNKPLADNNFLRQQFSKDKQWDFGIALLKKIGFDFESGRQDISLHPFTTNFNSSDVRVTTRIDEMDLSNMTWSCLHEGGHALYEQGLPADQYGLPLGEYCSLSIHESQSRFWENNIGRSLPFIENILPDIKSFFPEQLEGISAEIFYACINKVEPSFIRTEADELTYHFHVLTRYEIEKKLIEGSISTKDIPAYWNELYKKYLGLVVPDDKHGCLQDIHWGHGSFGYFATYSLGSLYAAQLYAAIDKKSPSTQQEIRNGEFGNVLGWLHKNIHRYGRFYDSEDLCLKTTGETLNTNYFIEYAFKKYG